MLSYCFFYEPRKASLLRAFFAYNVSRVAEVDGAQRRQFGRGRYTARTGYTLLDDEPRHSQNKSFLNPAPSFAEAHGYA